MGIFREGGGNKFIYSEMFGTKLNETKIFERRTICVRM